MANKQALRDLQSRLAERLQAARTEARGRVLAGRRVRPRGFLFPLRDAGEIFPLAPLLPVPHSQPLVPRRREPARPPARRRRPRRLPRPAQERPTSSRDQSRLVGFNQALDINCALLVERLAGLRGEDQLTARADDAGGAAAVRRRALARRRRRGSGRRSTCRRWRATKQFLAIVG